MTPHREIVAAVAGAIVDPQNPTKLYFTAVAQPDVRICSGGGSDGMDGGRSGDEGGGCSNGSHDEGGGSGGVSGNNSRVGQVVVKVHDAAPPEPPVTASRGAGLRQTPPGDR